MALSTGPQAGMAHPLSNTEACPFLCFLRESVYRVSWLGGQGQSGNLGPQESSLPQRFVLFCGGWWGRLCSLQPAVPAPPRLGCLFWGAGRVASLGLSHMKEALGQEAGRQGYSSETGRTWVGVGGTGGRGESAHTGARKPLSVSALSSAPRRGPSSGLPWAPAPDPHSFTVHPPPLR